MKVSEIMSADMQMADSQDTVSDASKQMRDFDIGFLPVQENGKIVGAITDRDITIRCVAEDKDASSTPVSDVMTRKVLCCYDEDDVSDAARLMEQQQVRRLIVLDSDDRLCGVLSTGDMSQKTRDEHLIFEVFEKISEPGH